MRDEKKLARLERFELPTRCLEGPSEGFSQSADNHQPIVSQRQWRVVPVDGISNISAVCEATGHKTVTNGARSASKRSESASCYIVANRRIYEQEGEVSWRYCIDGRAARQSSERGQSPNFWKNFERNNKRSRATVRRKILSARLDYLLTLTTRKNIVEFEQAAILFGYFVRIVHRHVPEWPYVAVAEQQSRGAYHWHLAVKGWQNVDLLRKCWLSVCGDGNIDIQAPRGHKGNSQWRHIRLALYLGKYITKDLEMGDDGEVTVGRHRYRSSLGIEDPVERRTFPAFAGQEAVAVWLIEKTGVVGYQATFEDGKAGWMCSWSFGA